MDGHCIIIMHAALWVILDERGTFVAQSNLIYIINTDFLCGNRSVIDIAFFFQ